ncbi:isoflavone 4'-O-methyltransferase-like [Arachis stenosperma]|uniref:isoflavone 4'-O-methyltransferase-like n=1 Tax=Arachis stenosperma TaxID=217475 RepID=UPI0025AD01B7|nr:isoflavone 4'-O-methyltransferase-like [Arachis stenosperma]
MDLSANSNGTSSSEESELYHAQIHLYKHVYNWVSSMALKAVMELGVADVIHNHGKPLTLSHLASQLNLHPSKVGALHRFLRLLTHNGFFAKTKLREGQEEEDAYALTPPSKLLIKSKPTNLSPIVKGSLHWSSLNMWHSSEKWFTEDKEQTMHETSSGGQSFWDFLNNNPDCIAMFQDAMAADSYMFKIALKECRHVFENLGSIVDVGGGTGGVSKLIHQEFPQLKCTVFDQPEVVGNLKGDGNLNFVAGDMFKSIPSADAVLLKWILHDWNDEQALKILKNSKEAISERGKEGKVIIIDISIDETSDDKELIELKLDYDLVMLAMFNGKEREKKEWDKLIHEAGYSRYTITPICGFKSLIEVYP